MAYMKFKTIARNTWEVITVVPARSSDPIATIWKKRGKYSAVFNEDQAITREELEGMSAFMKSLR